MPLSSIETNSETFRRGAVRWQWRAHAPSLAAEPLARTWLAAQLGVAAELPALVRDARGRPTLGPPHSAHDCNWSHSGEGLLLALGEGVRVGVDLERIRPRPRALALAARFFTREETDWIAALADAAREQAFLRLWCAKEAVLKAHGHGLSFGLQRLRFEAVDDALRLVACDPALGAARDWSLHEFRPAAGYLAALAWRPL